MPMLDADAEWVSAAYAAHGPELYRFALRALGDAGMAEEAVQTTYVRAWRNADRFDDELGSLRTWLFAIVRNVIIDQTRARRVRPVTTSDEPAPDTGHPDDDVDRLLLAWQVEEALQLLSDDHRNALVETYYRGRPHAEVAAELGVPVGTIKSRVYYALRQLRLALEELGWADS